MRATKAKKKKVPKKTLITKAAKNPATVRMILVRVKTVIVTVRRVPTMTTTKKKKTSAVAAIPRAPTVTTMKARFRLRKQIREKVLKLMLLGKEKKL